MDINGNNDTLKGKALSHFTMLTILAKEVEIPLRETTEKGGNTKERKDPDS